MEFDPLDGAGRVIDLNVPVTGIALHDTSTLVIGTDQGTVVINLPLPD
ncbi:hypothetical protein ACTMTF_07240 [Nonomuraea sp. ZG12]